MITLKKLMGCLVFLSSLVVMGNTLAAMQNDAVGHWTTIDDKTGRARSIIQIWQTPKGTLQGHIVKTFPTAEEEQRDHGICTTCVGANKNKPYVGMVIMWGFKHKENKWVDGKIMDPNSGDIYRCTLEVTPSGDHLKVHGYIGLPVFGRTQSWERA